LAKTAAKFVWPKPPRSSFGQNRREVRLAKTAHSVRLPRALAINGNAAVLASSDPLGWLALLRLQKRMCGIHRMSKSEDEENI